MKDISGGSRSDVIFKNGVCYAWDGNDFVELTTTELTALVAGTQAITSNIGSANTGVTALEYGNSYKHQTVLTLAQVAAMTSGDNENLADGYLIYTFPAGEIIINSATMQIALTNAEHAAETPEVGLGTVIGTGAVADLDTPGTFEDIITGTAVAGMAAEILTLTAIPTAAVPFVIADGDAHTLHLNMASAWVDTAGSALDVDLAGLVIIDWSYMGNPA